MTSMITNIEARDRIETIFATAKPAGNTQKRGTKRITSMGPFAYSEEHGVCVTTFLYGYQYMKKASKCDGWVGYYAVGELVNQMGRGTTPREYDARYEGGLLTHEEFAAAWSPVPKSRSLDERR